MSRGVPLKCPMQNTLFNPSYKVHCYLQTSFPCSVFLSTCCTRLRHDYTRTLEHQNTVMFDQSQHLFSSTLFFSKLRCDTFRLVVRSLYETVCSEWGDGLANARQVLYEHVNIVRNWRSVIWPDVVVVAACVIVVAGLIAVVSEIVDNSTASTTKAAVV